MDQISYPHLTPQLIGLERQRVEVVDRNLDVRSFVVGRSSGFIPIHLELKNERARGSIGVIGAPFHYVRVVAPNRGRPGRCSAHRAGARP